MLKFSGISEESWSAIEENIYYFKYHYFCIGFQFGGFSKPGKTIIIMRSLEKLTVMIFLYIKQFSTGRNMRTEGKITAMVKKMKIKHQSTRYREYYYNDNFI